MKLVIFSLGVLFSVPLIAEENQIIAGENQSALAADLVFDAPVEKTDGSDKTTLNFDNTPSNDLSLTDEKASSPASDFFAPMRFTWKYETSYRTEDPKEILDDRTSFRLEYSKFFLDDFFIQFDTKVNAFLDKDHRAEAEDKQTLFETTSKEAFLQYSSGNTSVKAGVQTIIWGESEGGAITDVISPRNLSELYFISLEESRIGQFMLNVDQFSELGYWSLFYGPQATFNKYPARGTAYYVDPFNGQAILRDDPSDKRDDEYGMRWKKTFGKSDISFMAASLVDNDYAYRLDGTTDAGSLLITKVKERFDMAGITFNYAAGNLLYKGEVGYKSPKVFNTVTYQLIEKNIVDSSLKFEYSITGSDSVSLEMVNDHIIDWTEDIQNTPKNSNSLILMLNGSFFNDLLSVNWLTIHSEPYAGYQHSLRTSYKWSDNVVFNFEAHTLNISDKKNPLWVYRNQDQIVFKVQYQF